MTYPNIKFVPHNYYKSKEENVNNDILSYTLFLKLIQSREKTIQNKYYSNI